MYKPFIKTASINLLCLTSFMFFGVAQATKNDIEQEVSIKSERTAADLKNKIISYLDNVKIQQGSLTIQADLVQVYGKANSKKKIYIASGKPAIFSQLLDDGTPIKLQADEIRYEPMKNTITLKGNAEVSQAGSYSKGSKIEYNILTETLLAESAPEQQVTTILKPRKD